MEVLRTPDERFAALAGYPYAPSYLEVGSPESGPLRIHYVEAGPQGADAVVLVHGQPTWSDLFRRVIDRLAGAGHRVIAPALVGFGRSDKPAERVGRSSSPPTTPRSPKSGSRPGCGSSPRSCPSPATTRRPPSTGPRGRPSSASTDRCSPPTSDGDDASAGWDAVFRQRVPGAAGQAHRTIAGAGHFVPEEKGDELAEVVAEFLAGNASL